MTAINVDFDLTTRKIFVMPAINVDFEIFKLITSRRSSESMSENDVLRDVFGLPQILQPSNVAAPINMGELPCILKGVTFPHGTQFRHTHKGQQHSASIENGSFVMSGKKFSSLSGAAVEITGNPRNGWYFWECLLPQSTEWKLANEV